MAVATVELCNSICTDGYLPLTSVELGPPGLLQQRIDKWRPVSRTLEVTKNLSGIVALSFGPGNMLFNFLGYIKDYGLSTDAFTDGVWLPKAYAGVAAVATLAAVAAWRGSKWVREQMVIREGERSDYQLPGLARLTALG